MISKKLSKLPKFLFKKFKRENKCIFDIVIYGSAVRGKEKLRDLDIAIILSENKSLSFKLNLSQKIKQVLSKITEYELDIKTMDFNDLLDKNFIARTGILAEGFSMLKNKFLSDLFGFKSSTIFVYNLNNLSPSKKRIFNYALSGRNKQKGMLQIKNCEPLGKGVVNVPIQSVEEFKDFLELYKISYRIKKILFY